jgi:tryptophan 2,3-dioxygenase
MASKKSLESSEAVPAKKNSGLTYNTYLLVDQLKQLQNCQSQPAHHDEPLFIIIHQAYELWFKLILHELDLVFQLIAVDRARKATFYMKRVIEILKLLVQQIHILETMSPKEFLGFRYNLTPASGFGSSQFREIEFAAGLRNQDLLEHFANEPSYEILQKRYTAPSLQEAFYELLKKHGFKLPYAQDGSDAAQVAAAENERLLELRRLYDEEEPNAALHDLAETFVSFDELLFLWRSNHVIVVERMIGFKRGTGGSEGVGYLQTTLAKRCFPDLWKLRTLLENPDAPASEGTQPAAQCPFHSHS